MRIDDVHSTILSMLDAIADAEPAVRRQAMELFCNRYTQPLVDFLVATRRLQPDQALDVVQDFWLCKMISPPPDEHLVSKFLEKREQLPALQFRRYLARALINYLHSSFRKWSREPSGPRSATLDGCEFAEEQDLDQFDIAWANHLLSRVLQSVQRECCSQGQRQYWLLFERQVLLPTTIGAPVPSYSELFEELGFKSPKQASNAMQTMVRKFHRAFEKIVEDYLPSRDRQLSNSEMMLEIQVLWAKLAKAGNLHLTQSIDTEDSWIVNFSVTTMAPATCGLTIATLTSAQMFATLEDYRTGWQAMIEEPLNHCLPVGEVTFLPPELCFRELLSSSAPQWETLDLVRSRAKRAGLRTEAGNDGASDYPLEMYGLMYLLAILISDLRCHKKISKNAPQQLQRKARQAQTVPWLDGASLAVLREFLQG